MSISTGRAGRYDNGKLYWCAARRKYVTGTQCLECFASMPLIHQERYDYSRTYCMEENRHDGYSSEIMNLL